MMAAAMEDGAQRQPRRLTPVCASCGRIRHRAGLWRPAAAGRCIPFNTEVTHTLCPRCTARLYPAFARNRSIGPSTRLR